MQISCCEGNAGTGKSRHVRREVSLLDGCKRDREEYIGVRLVIHIILPLFHFDILGLFDRREFCRISPVGDILEKGLGD